MIREISIVLFNEPCAHLLSALRSYLAKGRPGPAAVLRQKDICTHEKDLGHARSHLILRGLSTYRPIEWREEMG